MMPSVQNAQPRLAGEPAVPVTEHGTQPVTVSQLRILNQLVSQLSVLTGQTESAHWRLLRHDLGVMDDAPLLARHFPAAEQNLNQRLMLPAQTSSHQQLLNQLSEVIGKNDHRQAVSDYLLRQFGHSSLSQLTQEQLRHLLTMLQNGQLKHHGNPSGVMASAQTSAVAGKTTVINPFTMTPFSVRDIAQLSQPQITLALNQLLTQGENRIQMINYLQQQFGHSVINLLTAQQQKTVLTLLLSGQLSGTASAQQQLTPSQLNSLNQQVLRLASDTGEPPVRIWQSILTLSNVQMAAQIPASYFSLFSHWLLSQQQLAHQPAPVLQHIQQHLPAPVTAQEWQQIVNHAQQQWQITANSILTSAQLQQVMYLVAQHQIKQAAYQTEHHLLQPVYNPLFAWFRDPVKALSARPGLMLVMIISAIALLWLLI